MRKKGLVLSMMAALMLAGCKGSEWPEVEKMPTVTPTVAESEETEEENSENEEESGEGLSSILSYVDKSKQAADEANAATVKAAVQVAYLDACTQGYELQENPLTFRVTDEMEELDGANELFRKTLLDILGEPVKVHAENSYFSVELSVDETNYPNVTVTIVQE